MAAHDKLRAVDFADVECTDGCLDAKGSVILEDDANPLDAMTFLRIGPGWIVSFKTDPVLARLALLARKTHVLAREGIVAGQVDLALQAGRAAGRRPGPP